MCLDPLLYSTESGKKRTYRSQGRATEDKRPCGAGSFVMTSVLSLPLLYCKRMAIVQGESAAMPIQNHHNQAKLIE